MINMKHGVLRYFISVVLIGLGVILVLDNIGMIDSDFSETWHYLYPIFFVLLGFKWVIRFFQRGGSSWIGGSFLIIFGSLLILGRLEQTSITFSFSDIFKLWPLL